MYAGELVLFNLHDLGGEVRIQEAARLAASFPLVASAEPSKNTPPYVELGGPLAFDFGAREIETARGMVVAHFTARVYAIGAVAVSIRIPFELASLAAVNEFSHIRLSTGKSVRSLTTEIVARLRETIAPALVETYDAKVEPEGYLVLVLTKTDAPADELLEKQRSMLAGIVAGELVPERLSDEEVEDNLAFSYRYYNDDLVVVDWDRSLVIEPTGKFDDVLSVMEIANLELLELRAYDRYLDDVLEDAYEDLTRFYGRGGLFRSARGVQEELSNARIDLVRVTDAINNIGKIFGDYYLAKLHLGLTERFHTPEWEAIVREKMATLNELYTLASHEVEHRRGVVLEVMIILLFVIDLVLIYMVSGT